MSSFFRNTGYAWPHTALHPQSSLEGLKALSWFQRFLNYAAGNGTDDDHATVRKKISLVQNILFCDYPDTLPAHSRKTRFNMLQTTCPCIWLQCALVCLRYIYWNVCAWNIFADHPLEIPSLFLSQAFTASKCCSTHNLLASTSSIAFKISQWINTFWKKMFSKPAPQLWQRSQARPCVGRADFAAGEDLRLTSLALRLPPPRNIKSILQMALLSTLTMFFTL